MCSPESAVPPCPWTTCPWLLLREHRQPFDVPPSSPWSASRARTASHQSTNGQPSRSADCQPRVLPAEAQPPGLAPAPLRCMHRTLLRLPLWTWTELWSLAPSGPSTAVYLVLVACSNQHLLDPLVRAGPAPPSQPPHLEWRPCLIAQHPPSPVSPTMQTSLHASPCPPLGACACRARCLEWQTAPAPQLPWPLAAHTPFSLPPSSPCRCDPSSPGE